MRQGRRQFVFPERRQPGAGAEATVGTSHAQHAQRVPRAAAGLGRLGGRRVADQRDRLQLAADVGQRGHVPREHAVRGRAAGRGHTAHFPEAVDGEEGAQLVVVVVVAPPPSPRSPTATPTPAAAPQQGVHRFVSQHCGQVRHRRIPLVIFALLS